MTEEELRTLKFIIVQLDRYGHHDHDCKPDTYEVNRPCACGFNQHFQVALGLVRGLLSEGGR